MQRHGRVVDDLHALDRAHVSGHLTRPRGRIEDALDVVPDGLGVEAGAVLETTSLRRVNVHSSATSLDDHAVARAGWNPPSGPMISRGSAIM